LPKEVLEQLTNPERVEPLSLGTGEAFVILAEAKNENMVASLGDEGFQYGFYLGFQPITPSMFMSTIRQAFMNVEEKDGWLTLSSRAPATARRTRMDRALLGQFLRAIAKEGRASLDQMANYAIGVEGELYNSLGFSMMQMIVPYQMDMYYEASMLRFYGHLSASERQTLSRGGTLAIGRLTSPQSAAINEMIFGSRSDLQPKMKGGQYSGEDYEAFYNGIKREPTEMFANGLPPNSLVKLTDQTTGVAGVPPYSGANGVYFGGRAMGPDEIAQVLYAKERPGVLPWLDGDPGFEGRKFRYGNRRMLQFNFEFGEIAQMSKALQDTDYGNGAEVAFDQLPDDFKKQIDAKLVEMRKNYKDVKPGDYGNVGGGKVSPPPPKLWP
jgi:hypothetical protein